MHRTGREAHPLYHACAGAVRFQPDKIILFGFPSYVTPIAASEVYILVVMPARNRHNLAVRRRRWHGGWRRGDAFL
jgi:hypothetical protein